MPFRGWLQQSRKSWNASRRICSCQGLHHSQSGSTLQWFCWSHFVCEWELTLGDCTAARKVNCDCRPEITVRSTPAAVVNRTAKNRDENCFKVALKTLLTLPDTDPCRPSSPPQRLVIAIRTRARGVVWRSLPRLQEYVTCKQRQNLPSLQKRGIDLEIQTLDKLEHRELGNIV